MTFQEYTEAALRTANPDNSPLSLAVLALGLCGEVSELYDALVCAELECEGHSEKESVEKEAGDVLWYAAVLGSRIGFKDDWDPLGWAVPSTGSEPELAQEMMFAACRIAELVKKHVGHMKQMDAYTCGYYLESVLGFLSTLMKRRKIHLSYIAFENIEKLTARYPNGFQVTP
jgi:hypothetical protein